MTLHGGSSFNAHEAAPLRNVSVTHLRHQARDRDERGVQLGFHTGVRMDRLVSQKVADGTYALVDRWASPLPRFCARQVVLTIP